MSKKRVYELAKELGIENKDLISRLEKLGVSVKSHSSALEDSDVERVQRDFFAGENQEIEEKRIKSTVIRRRAVRSAHEEETPQPQEPEQVTQEAVAVVRETPAPAPPVVETVVPERKPEPPSEPAVPPKTAKPIAETPPPEALIAKPESQPVIPAVLHPVTEERGKAVKAPEPVTAPTAPVAERVPVPEKRFVPEKETRSPPPPRRR